MTSMKMMKRLIPAMVAGAAAIVMTLPVNASAAGWRGRGAGASNRIIVRHDRPFRQRFVPAPVVRHDALGRTWHHDWDHDGDHDGWRHRDWDRDEWRDRAYVPEYRPYVPAAPIYAAPAPVYSTPYYGYGAGPCANVEHLQGVYRHDRRTGHPEAANDVARQLRGAENRCYGYSGYDPYDNYAYGNSVFSPVLGNLFGNW